MQGQLWDAVEWPEGLSIHHDYITPQHEDELVSIIDGGVWEGRIARRIQQYGFAYQTPKVRLGPLPRWAEVLGERFAADGFMEAPHALIVNEYLEGQGIAPHADKDWFGPTVCNLNLVDTWGMDLTRESDHVVIPMERRALVVMSGPSRMEWHHAIVPRQKDVLNGVVKLRGPRRISLTFRTICS